MPASSTELARLAGPKSKDLVSDTIKRWEEKIRERIRSEMALKLVDDPGSRKEVQRVAVMITDGLPLALIPYEQDLKEKLEEIAGLFRPHLQNLKDSFVELQQLLKELGTRDPRWAERAEKEESGIVGVQRLVRDLMELAEQAKFAEKLKQIDEDVLGAYFPLGKNPSHIYIMAPIPIIEIYWTVIGAVARIIQVDIEGLTIAVMAHELAHAYSHLGADTDGKRWDDRAFCASDGYIKEGIAQYYTAKVMKWFRQRHNDSPYHAYAELLKA